jgi:hypothetical protein
LVLRGSLGVTDWLHNRITVSQVELAGVHCDVWQTGPNQWSTEILKPCKRPYESHDAFPRVIFKDASVQLRKSATTDAPAIQLHDLAGSVEETYEGLGETRTKIVKAILSGRSAGNVNDLQISATLAPDQLAWRVLGKFEALQFNKALLDKLPDQLAQYANQLSGLECSASAGFELTLRPNAEQPDLNLIRTSTVWD